MRKRINVAAGLVFRQGKLLITQRPATSHLGGLWEFPGGKLEPGESWEACLARELEEELLIRVRVGRLIESLDHDYPDKSVHLRFFICEWLENEPAAIGCDDLRWVTKSELPSYRFPEADARLLGILQDNSGFWKAPQI